jgi:hypothetical protein
VRGASDHRRGCPFVSFPYKEAHLDKMLPKWIIVDTRPSYSGLKDLFPLLLRVLLAVVPQLQQFLGIVLD